MVLERLTASILSSTQKKNCPASDTSRERDKSTVEKKTTTCLCPELLEKSKLTEGEGGSLHRSAGPLKHGYHVSKDDMANAMGTSGWTHIADRWVPRSQKNKLKKSDTASPRTLQSHKQRK